MPNVMEHFIALFIFQTLESTSAFGFSKHTPLVKKIEQHALKKYKQLFECHHLLLLRDVWWSKF
jgi:hypothetical protein